MQAGVRPPRRHLDLLGIQGRLFRFRKRCAGLLRRAALHARDADGGAELAAMVQHRPALGLRHRRAEPGPFLCRRQDRRGGEVDHRLRASAAARLLHPVDRRRSRQRGRDHGPVGARGAAVQIRLRHRHEFFPAARRRRAALRRRQILRPDELPQDRRPRCRRHQVGRHHAPRRQDGDRRRRSSRHRAVHRLEGDRGAEGREPRHRLEDQPEAPARHPQGLRELRGLGRRLLRSRQEPGPAPRDQGGPPQPGARQLHPPGHPVRQAGLYRHSLPDLRHRLGFGRLSHGLGAELQQFGAHHRRIPQGGRGRPRLGSLLAHQARQDFQDGEGARAVGEDRPRRLGERRSRPAISHDHQRLAHLPGVGADHRVESVLGIHVPRRHRLQFGVAEPARVRPHPSLPRKRGSGRPGVSGYGFRAPACGRPRNDANIRHRRLRARGAAVDRSCSKSR